MHRVVPRCAQPGRDFGGEVGVDEEPHQSGRAGERELVFLERVGGEFERGQDVCSFQVGIVGEDLLGGLAGGELADDRADGDPGIADAGQAAHPRRVAVKTG